MAASGDLGTKAIIALDIGFGFAVQDQGLRRIKWRPANHLAVDQPVQLVQHMGLGRHALCQGKFHRGENGLFIVVQHQGEDVHHLPIAAGFARAM